MQSYYDTIFQSCLTRSKIFHSDSTESTTAVIKGTPQREFLPEDFLERAFPKRFTRYMNAFRICVFEFSGDLIYQYFEYE
jgi:hypothetical protein